MKRVLAMARFLSAMAVLTLATAAIAWALGAWIDNPTVIALALFVAVGLLVSAPGTQRLLFGADNDDPWNRSLWTLAAHALRGRGQLASGLAWRPAMPADKAWLQPAGARSLVGDRVVAVGADDPARRCVVEHLLHGPKERPRFTLVVLDADGALWSKADFAKWPDQWTGVRVGEGSAA